MVRAVLADSKLVESIWLQLHDPHVGTTCRCTNVSTGITSSVLPSAHHKLIEVFFSFLSSSKIFLVILWSNRFTTFKFWEPSPLYRQLFPRKLAVGCDCEYWETRGLFSRHHRTIPIRTVSRSRPSRILPWLTRSLSHRSRRPQEKTPQYNRSYHSPWSRCAGSRRCPRRSDARTLFRVRTVGPRFSSNFAEKWIIVRCFRVLNSVVWKL